MGLSVHTLTADDRPDYASRVAALEASARYPLGDDFFTLDHGADYFAFFDRMGQTTHDVVLDRDRVVAVSARVLRRIGDETAWYLCDLKVHPDYRGRHLPFRMAAHAIAGAYRRCSRGYGISMNPSGGRENRVVRLLNRMRVVPLKHAAELVLFSLDAAQMADVAALVTAHRGPLSYLSLRGVKDVVLASTGAPMPLLHVQFGPCAETGQADVQPGAVHMFCSPRGDALTDALLTRGVPEDASAAVVQHGMGEADFRFVLTSEI
ncbi:MAG: hypothetical protein AB8I08_29815 [Sandaracinaceae bacterium]